MMETSQVSRLLPLYVAGSATDEERRAVEEALSGSEELREELEFWKHVQHPAVRTIRTSTGGNDCGLR